MTKMRRSLFLWAVLAAAVAGILVVGTIAVRRPGPARNAHAPAWQFRIADRATLSYGFDVSADTAMDPSIGQAVSGKTGSGGDSGAPPRMARMRFEARGGIELRFFARETGGARDIAGRGVARGQDVADGWNVAGMLSDVGVLKLNEATPDYAAAIGVPFSFRMGSQGALSHFSFPETTPPEARAFVSQLVSSMQTVLPPSRQDSWRVTEEDFNGWYEATCSRAVARAGAGIADQNAFEVIKQKARYVDVRSGGSRGAPQLAGSSIRVVRSEWKTEVAEGEGWIHGTSGVESLEYLVRGRPWSMSATRIAIRRRDLPGGQWFPETFGKFESLIRSTKVAEIRPGGAGQGAGPPVEGLSLVDALARFHALAAGSSADRLAADRLMLAYLRRYPEKTAELLTLLDGDLEYKQFAEREHLTLWRLVVESGTREAQAAVMKAIKDPSMSRGSHIRGLVHAGDFEDPEPSYVADLWKVHREPRRYGAKGTAEEAENMSLLAIGALGHESKRNEQVKEAVREQLTQNLASASSTEEKELTLKAIGNTGNSHLLEVVKPYLRSSGEGVRRAACDSMRRMEDPEAQKELIQVVETDASPGVRQAALRALAEMPLSEETMAWVREAVLRAKTPGEAVMLVDILGRALARFPENQAALRALLATNPPAGVKSTVYRFIAPSGQPR